MMASDGFGVDHAMGSVSQRQLIEEIHYLDTKAGFEMGHVRLVRATRDACVLVYQLRQWGRFKENGLPPVVWCTSVWSRVTGHWMGIYHQETPAVVDCRNGAE